MSSILDQPAIRRAVLPITVEQYHRLGEAGIVAVKTELLCGVIVEKMIKSPQYTWIVQFLVDWLRSALRENVHVRQEQPLTLEDSEPEPDVAVVDGTPDDYRRAHPRAARLVMEVAYSTIELDREKTHIYAAAGVPEYWLVLPGGQSVEVFTEPTETGYARRSIHRAADSVHVGPFPTLSLTLKNLFPE
jgi:Uma2 family endonuclease